MNDELAAAIAVYAAAAAEVVLDDAGAARCAARAVLAALTETKGETDE